VYEGLESAKKVITHTNRRTNVDVVQEASAKIKAFFESIEQRAKSKQIYDVHRRDVSTTKI
jgi:hypothetical protein